MAKSTKVACRDFVHAAIVSKGNHKWCVSHVSRPEMCVSCNQHDAECSVGPQVDWPVDLRGWSSSAESCWTTQPLRSDDT